MSVESPRAKTAKIRCKIFFGKHTKLFYLRNKRYGRLLLKLEFLYKHKHSVA
jgi:hypothetical protein